MSSLLEQSLQIPLQEPTVLGLLAVLAVGVLGMSIRGLLGASAEEETAPTAEEGPDPRAVTDGSGGRRPPADGSDEREAEFENRLDHLEEEVDDLSSTVESVQHENEAIAENVEEVNSNLERLLKLSSSFARGINPFSTDDETDEPVDAFQRNARSTDTEPEPDRDDDVNRHQPVTHDKVETIPGGTGAAEEFDRMEEEVEELDTLSFSDDSETDFGDSEPADLGQEEVIAGTEPAPTGDAIGDGGTLIETTEEELDIEPAQVSEPSASQEPTPPVEGPDEEPAPEVESGFEFGVKPGEDASTDDETDSPNQENSADKPTTEEPAEPLAVDQLTDGETTTEESTPLDDETEAELAAAEAAFAAEFDSDDELSLDLNAADAETVGDPQESTANPVEQLAESTDAAPAEGTSPEPSGAEERTVLPFEELADSAESSEPAGQQASETEFEQTGEEIPEPKPDDDPEGVETPSPGSLSQHVPVSADSKPYIESLPAGYSTELLVVEWLESLVEDIGVHGTARAIDYYESLDWITADVADQLDTYLSAFASGDADTLGVDQHLQSLEYVDELARSAESESEDDE